MLMDIKLDAKDSKNIIKSVNSKEASKKYAGGKANWMDTEKNYSKTKEKNGGKNSLDYSNNLKNSKNGKKDSQKDGENGEEN